jgi:gamma-butyrobetaine dioxygenase
VHHRLARALAAQPTPMREAVLGAPSTPEPERERRLRIVLEMLRGASPGVLSRRHGVPEPELYRWRDAALRAAEDALAEPTPATEHHAALDRLCGELDRALDRDRDRR